MENIEVVAKANALSDENRVRILRMLATRELCACSILEYLGISQPTLSYHMRLLTESGLVNARRSGKWTYYSLDSASLRSFAENIAEISQTNIDDLPNSVCDE